MRGEGDAAGKQRCGPAPRFRSSGGGAERQQSGRGRPNEGVDRLPDRINVRNLVGEKLHHIKSDGNAQHDRVREDLQMRRQVNHAKALQQSQRGDGSVKIQARGKAGAKDETESLNWIHGFANSTNRQLGG